MWCCFSAPVRITTTLEMRFKGCREAVSFPYRRSSCDYDNFCTLTHFVYCAELFFKADQRQVGSHGVAMNCAVLQPTICAS